MSDSLLYLFDPFTNRQITRQNNGRTLRHLHFFKEESVYIVDITWSFRISPL
jgi:hypothetical protein